MTLAYHVLLRPETAEDRPAGPNQRFKDFLNAEIDAKLLRGRPTESAGTAHPEKGARS
ncbi:hypothetical protein OG349_04705 [Streptomyces sp. NBC_01317]|uniref:hypothetical protein n=1 Tax=Streptomyces sp. NBC_01317 TaxID=2903822 RepID=UPI002E0D6004|nr:hypothetical protein OG349_04705 [Streptomyces sp. NBC_01317]